MDVQRCSWLPRFLSFPLNLKLSLVVRCIILLCTTKKGKRNAANLKSDVLADRTMFQDLRNGEMQKKKEKEIAFQNL